NDGLNTVVPYCDPEYRKNRPTLAIPENRVRKIDDHLGFHPALSSFSQLLEARRLAIVQGVGYSAPNRSHFESLAIWHTPDPRPGAETSGWLARSLDPHKAREGGRVSALHVGDAALPQALYGGPGPVLSLENLEQFRRRLGVPAASGVAEQRSALD